MTRPLFDKDAERAVIGAAFIDPSVLDRVALTALHFAGIPERRIWQAMLDLHADGKPMDEIVVADRAQVELCFIAKCAVHTPTADNAEHYADIVRQYAVSRSVLAALSNVQSMHAKGEAHGAELLDAALKAFTAIDLDRERQTRTIGQLLRARFKELDDQLAAREHDEPGITGVPTGISRLDDITNGLQRGIVTVVAARPGMGKSALALGVADAASAAGHGVHVFSLEDTGSVYADRALARSSGAPVEDIRTARLKRRDMLRVVASAGELTRRSHWLFEDISDISTEELVRSVRRERARNQTALVIVDYLTLLRRPRRFESMHDAVTQNIETLARAAKHDNMSYLVLSQLSRGVDKRTDRRPIAADLRESGSIEERAKCILAIYRGAVYGEPRAGIDYDPDDPDDQRPTHEEWERRADILILKNSNGRTGNVRCRWNGPCIRIDG